MNEALRVLLENIDEHPFGIITQRGYQELEDKIYERAEIFENRFHRWFLIGLVGLSFIALTSAVALIGFGVLLTKQGNLTNEIQEQRHHALLDACRDQNRRHDNVIAQIDKAVAETPPPPPKKEREKQAKPFKLILEAAVPHTKDCPTYARERVEGDGR